MLRLTVLAVLPLLALSALDTWDPRFARLRGISEDNPVIHTEAQRNALKTDEATTYGPWDCPWHLGGDGCADGEYKCTCSDGRTAKFSIGCCYNFPKCGEMCHNWHCGRYTRCASCKSKVGEWDMNACNSCVQGFVYESGLCDRDRNECAYNNGDCEQRCHNSYGSYSCSCYNGFRLDGDNHACQRLSCPAVDSSLDVTVTATENWLFHSYATFETTNRAMTLNGPELADCKADSSRVYWSAARPNAVDTCTYVDNDVRMQCSDSNISEEKCRQLGCCYDGSATDSPTCYINPAKSFYKIGGIAPSGDNWLVVRHQHYSAETCAHACRNEYGNLCKSYGIEETGRNASHGVVFRDCHILSKSAAELEEGGNIIAEENYDMYESLQLSTADDITMDAGISKQYVGCYHENDASRDLSYHVMRSLTHMTPTMCAALCRDQRYKYAGVQNGVDCYCGNEMYRKYGEAQSCDTPCSGDSSVTCGGATVNSVYNVAWTDLYQGCYLDDATSHDLPFYVWGKDAGRSAEECMDQCAQRGYLYAGLQDGGVCYCGNEFGQYGGANETSCYTHCYGYSRQNCGGNLRNAVYKVKSVSRFDSPGATPYRLYDPSGSLSGVSTTLFTMFPGLQSILSKRLIIHSATTIVTPSDDLCGPDCYQPCGNIYQEAGIDNKGSDVTLRFFYINLSDLDDYVGLAAERVFVHAQTVVIDRDINLRYALYLRARTIVMDRSRSYYIDVPSDAKQFDLDVEAQKFYDPEADTLLQKQSIMCARILLNTMDSDYSNTAFAILNDVARTQTQNAETQRMANTARNLVVEEAGLVRDDIRYVPFYTKAHIKLLLDNYFEQISIYEEQLDKLLDEANTKDQILDYTQGMQDIYSDTNILEASTQFEAAIDAVQRSNATYHRFRLEYNGSRDELEDARLVFEDGLAEEKKWAFGRFLIDVIASIAKTTLGGLEYNKTTSDEDIEGIRVNVQELFALMQELSNTIEQIDALSEVCDRVINEIETTENDFEAARYYDQIEMAVQLEVNIIKWMNLKNYGDTLLSEDGVADIRGSSEYHRALLDVCNWGEALTRCMVERAEMMREAMEKRTILDLKTEQKRRIDEHIQEYRDGVFASELLINEMVEQVYDIRLDLNDALLTFCQAYFYENMFECKPAYRPSFGGSLQNLLLKINAAKRDDLLVGSAPSTLRRYITVTDTNTDPDCSDATVCPINYLRANRLLYVTVPTDHPELADMDAYKVSEMILSFEGARMTTDREYLKVRIESSGDFQGRADGVTHNFMTRALSLTFEYSLVDNHITVHADVYAPFRNIIQHITPFTTWVMRVSDDRSDHVDLSEVTSVRIQFNGSGVDNETWKRKAKEALGE